MPPPPQSFPWALPEDAQALRRAQQQHNRCFIRVDAAAAAREGANYAKHYLRIINPKCSALRQYHRFFYLRTKTLLDHPPPPPLPRCRDPPPHSESNNRATSFALPAYPETEMLDSNKSQRHATCLLISSSHLIPVCSSGSTFSRVAVVVHL